MRLTYCALAFALSALSSAAQSVVRSFVGDTPGGRLGAAFDALGDVDGDGVADLVAGYPGDDTAGVDAGRAVVLSGADGSLIWDLFGEAAGDGFGTEVSDGGFVDTDAVADFVVAAPLRGQGKGAVYVYSGASGARIHFMRGLMPGDLLGTAIDRAGDVDGDGRDDIVVGAPGVDYSMVTDVGRVYVYSGADATLLHEFMPVFPARDIGFGLSVTWVGDVDGDGHADVLAGTPRTDLFGYAPGQATLFSGIDGAPIRHYYGQDQGHGFLDFLPLGMAGIGDVDGDGRSDYMLGERNLNRGGPLGVLVYSGASGQVLATHLTQTTLTLPLVMAGVGDVDGDGVADYGFGGFAGEALRIYSGASRSELQDLSWPSSVGFGARIAGLGDVDGDGLGDIAVGAPEYDGAAGADTGLIAVFAGNRCGAAANYCSGAPHSAGPGGVMRYAGSSSVPHANLVLRATQCPPDKFGLFFYGPAQIQAPFGDGLRCVGAGGIGTFRLNPVQMTDASGEASLALDYNAPPAGSGAGRIDPGSTWNFQFWFRDPMGPGGSGFNLTDGLSLSFCD